MAYIRGLLSLVMPVVLGALQEGASLSVQCNLGRPWSTSCQLGSNFQTACLFNMHAMTTLPTLAAPLSPHPSRMRLWHLLHSPPGAESHTVLLTDIPGIHYGTLPHRIDTTLLRLLPQRECSTCKECG